MRGGFHSKYCTCETCSKMTLEELEVREEKHRQMRSKGGKTRSAQASMQLARRRGGVTTYNKAIMSGDPLEIARVKYFCRDYNVAKAERTGKTPAAIRKENVAITREYMKQGLIVRDDG